VIIAFLPANRELDMSKSKVFTLFCNRKSTTLRSQAMLLPPGSNATARSLALMRWESR
jgi:hypothetical protein